MVSARLATASLLALIMAPTIALADNVCERLTGAVAMAANGFDLAEGDPITTDNGQYWHSKIQFSDGDNCAIEAHKLLTCSWEPSTAADLKKMIDTVSGCFPDAHPDTIKPEDDPDGPPGARFTLDQASLEIGLTADVMSLDIGPKAAPVAATPDNGPATPEAAAAPAPATPDASPSTTVSAPPTPDSAPTPAPASTAAAPDVAPAPSTTPQPTPDAALTPPPSPPEAAPQPSPAPAAPDVAPPNATPQPTPDAELAPPSTSTPAPPPSPAPLVPDVPPPSPPSAALQPAPDQPLPLPPPDTTPAQQPAPTATDAAPPPNATPEPKAAVAPAP